MTLIATTTSIEKCKNVQFLSQNHFGAKCVLTGKQNCSTYCAVHCWIHKWLELENFLQKR